MEQRRKDIRVVYMMAGIGKVTSGGLSGIHSLAGNVLVLQVVMVVRRGANLRLKNWRILCL